MVERKLSTKHRTQRKLKVLSWTHVDENRTKYFFEHCCGEWSIAIEIFKWERWTHGIVATIFFFCRDFNSIIFPFDNITVEPIIEIINVSKMLLEAACG